MKILWLDPFSWWEGVSWGKHLIPESASSSLLSPSPWSILLPTVGDIMSLPRMWILNKYVLSFLKITNRWPCYMSSRRLHINNRMQWSNQIRLTTRWICHALIIWRTILSYFGDQRASARYACLELAADLLILFLLLVQGITNISQCFASLFLCFNLYYSLYFWFTVCFHFHDRNTKYILLVLTITLFLLSIPTLEYKMKGPWVQENTIAIVSMFL